jgi:TP901 family phage tail tape measure protein
MQISDLLVRVRADISQAQTGLRQIRTELEQTGQAAREAGAQFDQFAGKMTRSFREAAAAQRQFNQELSLTRGRLAELTRGDVLAADRLRFKGFIAEGDLERLRRAREELRELTTQASADEAAVNRVTAAYQRFDKELQQTQARIAAIKSGALNAGLSAKSDGLVSDGDIARLATAKAELRELDTAQTRFQTQLAASRRELAAMQGGTWERLRETVAGNALPRLQKLYPGVPDAELQKLANIQQQTAGLEARKNLTGKLTSGAANTATGILGLGVLSALDFSSVETALIRLKNNAVMDQKEFEELRKIVLKLATDTGAPIEELALGFRHMSDFGFHGADAAKVMTVATRAAVATGSDLERTAQLLAKVLKENSLSANEAGKAMNLLWYAAANADVSMEQLVEKGGRVFAMASKMGVSLKETAAILSVFMANGIDASQATIQLINALNKLVMPTKEVRDKLDAITQATGINLRETFSLAGLQAKGLSGAFEDVRQAAVLLHEPYERLALELFPNLRGTIGALIGTSDSGMQGLKERMADMARIEREEYTPVQEAFTAQQKTMTAEIAKTVQAIRVEFLPAGQKFADIFKQGIPLVRDFADILKRLLDFFLNLPKPVREFVLGIGGITLAFRLLGNPITGVMGLLGDLITVWRRVKAASVEAMIAQQLAADAGGSAAGAGAAAGGVRGFFSRNAGLLGAIGIPAAVLTAEYYGGKALQETLWAGDAPRTNARFQEGIAAKERDPNYLRSRIKALSEEQRRINFGLEDYKGIPSKEGELVERSHRVYEEMSRLQDILAKLSQTAGPAGTALSMEIVRHASDALKTPAGQASCAYFASEVLRAAGVNIPLTGNAKQLADRLLSAGGIAKPGAQAAPGDYLLFHGLKYGNAPGQREGYHGAIYLGGGLMRQSSGVPGVNQRITTEPFRDVAHATAISVPAGLFGAASALGAATRAAAEARGPYAPPGVLDALHEKTKKLSEADRELLAYNKEMAAAQARLNALQTGGNKAAEQLAGKYRLLSDAQRQALQTVQERIQRKEQTAAQEAKFREQLTLTNAKIREAHTGELEGLAKLKQQYPLISEERLKYLLRQQQALETAEKDRQTQEKLRGELSGLKSQLQGTRAESDLHRLAFQLTGQTYEKLSAQARKLVDEIMGVKRELAGNSEVDKARRLLEEGQARLTIMQLPKEQRNVVNQFGGEATERLKLWTSMTEAQKENFVTTYRNIAANDALEESYKRAEENLAKFHAEMQAGINAHSARLAGNPEEASWQERLGANGGQFFKDLTSGGDWATIIGRIAQAREEFHRFYQGQEEKKKLDAATEAFKSLNAQLDVQMELLRLRASGQSDTAEGAWAEWLRGQKHPERYLDDPNEYARTMARFKEQWEFSRQIEHLDKFRQSLANTQKELSLLTAGSDFARFRAQMQEIDKDGKLLQPFTQEQLRKMFNAQQNLETVRLFADGTRGILRQMFTDILHGGKDLWSHLVGGFTKMFEEIAVNYLTSQFYNLIVRGLFGAGGAAPAAGGGGGFRIGGLIGGVIGGLFGGGGGTTLSGIAGPVSIGAGGTGYDFLTGSFQGAFATGGPLLGGRAALVGENGPELFLPHSAGRMIPNEDLGAFSGGNTVILHVHGVSDAASFRRSSGQILQDAHRGLQRAASRNRRG